MEAEIIHAVGVCFDVRERPAISTTPQACGVLSYHPRRRRVGVWDFVSPGESATRLGEALDPMAQILEVLWFDAQLQHFFDHCREVPCRKPFRTAGSGWSTATTAYSRR